tara:strand:- start:521 stop:1123 length:603 start_codon:yes stop_codon:yes gene_type:complete
MILTKYKIEDERFLFKADYDDELNVIYNHNEDKTTKEVFVSDNFGAFKGKIKFDQLTIDDYIQQAIGAAFPILVDKLGFVFTYDDLEARKDIIGKDKYNEILAKYPRLVKRINQLGKYTQVIYRVDTTHNFETGEQVTKVVFDNSEDNWWSSDSTPSYLTKDIFTPNEIEMYNNSLKGLVYLNPIERYLWNVINMMPKID